MKNFVFFAIIAIIMSSCSVLKNDEAETTTKTTNQTGKFVDSRDNKEYPTVIIGEQEWLAKNLDYKCDNSFYYKDNSRNSDYYGRLYTWDAAKKACPEGWRLPTDDDFKKLEIALGMPQQLADDTEWRGIDQGSRLLYKGNSGWNAVYGGYRNVDGNFDEMNEIGTYWTATEQSKNYAWGRGFEIENPKISRRAFGKTYGFSVRCVKE